LPLYTIQDNVDSQYASDVNQLVEGLTGNADIGQLKLLSPLSAPTAPTAAINTNLGNLTGAYKYVVAFVTGYWHGEPVTGTLLVQGNTGYGTESNTINPNGQQGAVSVIPTGPTGTVARILGRTKAGGSTFYRLAQINDNTTTSWTDNTSDAGLTVELSQTNTTGSKFVGDGSGLFNLNVAVPVSSVNSKTGAVVLTPSDVGAETPTGAQVKADAAAAIGVAAAGAVQEELAEHQAETVTDGVHGLDTTIAKFKKGNSSFTDNDTAQTFTDAFCTADSLVTVSITSATLPQGTWIVESAAGTFTITSTVVESADITFDYYVQKVV